MAASKSVQLIVLSVALLHLSQTAEIVGCYKEDVRNRHFQLSPGHYDPKSLTAEKCSSVCGAYLSSFAGLTDGRFCFCGSEKPADRYKEKTDANCDSSCSGNTAQTCGGRGYITVYHTFQPIKKLEMQVTGKTALAKTGDEVTFEVMSEAGYNLFYQMDYGDGTEGMDRNATGMFSKTYAIPGQHDAVVTASDSSGSVTKHGSAGVIVQAPVSNVSVDCPIFSSYERKACTVIITHGTNLLLHDKVDNKDRTIKVADPVIGVAGCCVPYTAKAQPESFSGDDNAIFIMPAAEFKFHGVVTQWELWADTAGKLTVMVLKPDCDDYCYEKNTCGGQCKGTTCSSDKSYCHQAGTCSNKCQQTNRYPSNTPLVDYVERQSVELKVSKGHQVVECPYMKVFPGDIIAYKKSTGSATITVSKKETTSDRKYDGPTKTFSKNSGNPVSKTRHHLKAIYSSQTKVSLDYNFQVAKKYTLSVNVSNVDIEGSETATTEIDVQEGINATILVGPKYLAVNTEGIFTILPHTGTDVKRDWDFGDKAVFNGTNTDQYKHIYASSGVYNIAVRCWNTQNTKKNVSMVTVEEKIIDISVKYSPCVTLTNCSFDVTVTGGSDFVITWDFGDSSINTTTQDEYLESHVVNHVYNMGGNLSVTANCSNHVSSKSFTFFLPVQEVCTGLSLIRNGTEKNVPFRIAWKLDQGSDCKFELTFREQNVLVEKANLTTLRWESVLQNGLPANIYPLTLKVHNDIGHDEIHVDFTIETAMKGMESKCNVTMIKTGEGASCIVTVKEGSNVRCTWDFDDGKVETFDQGAADWSLRASTPEIREHIFTKGKNHNVTITCSNNDRSEPHYHSILVIQGVDDVQIEHESAILSSRPGIGHFSFLTSGVAPNEAKAEFSFGDRQLETKELRMNYNYTHGYRDPGCYQVNVKISNRVSSKIFKNRRICVIEKIEGLQIVTDPVAAVLNNSVVAKVIMHRGPTGAVVNITCDYGDGEGKISFARQGKGIDGEDLRSITYNELGTKTITCDVRTPHENLTASHRVNVEVAVAADNCRITTNHPVEHGKKIVYSVLCKKEPMPTNAFVMIDHGDGTPPQKVMFSGKPGVPQTISYDPPNDGHFIAKISLSNGGSSINATLPAGSYSRLAGKPRNFKCMYKPVVPANSNLTGGIEGINEKFPTTSPLICNLQMDQGTPVNYVMTAAHETGSPVVVCNQRTLPINCKIAKPGSYEIDLKVTNPLGSSSPISADLKMRAPVKGLRVTDLTPKAKVNEEKKFKITFDSIGDETCLNIDFGDNGETSNYGEEQWCDDPKSSFQGGSYMDELTTPLEVTRTYSANRNYELKVTAANAFSDAIASLTFSFSSKGCAKPKVTIEDAVADITSPVMFEKGVRVIMRGKTNITCSASLKNTKSWTVEEVDSDSGSTLKTLDVTSQTAELVMKAKTVPYGLYKASYSVKMDLSDGSDLVESAFTYFKITKSKLVVVMETGGISEVDRGKNQMVTFSPEQYSFDPDVERSDDQGFENFTWGCLLKKKVSPESACDALNSRTGGSISFNTSIFEAGEQVQLTCNATKDTRSSVGKIIMNIVEGKPLNLYIEPVGGSMSVQLADSKMVSSKERIALRVRCKDCEKVKLSCEWTAYSYADGWPWRDYYANEVAGHINGLKKETITIKPSLYNIHPDVTKYRFACKCRQGEGDFSKAALNIQLNPPPKPGTCVISPKNGTLSLENNSPFNVKCSGWTDETEIVEYKFYCTHKSNKLHNQINTFKEADDVNIEPPLGADNDDYRENVFVSVKDSMDASYTYDLGIIQVFPPKKTKVGDWSAQQKQSTIAEIERLKAAGDQKMLTEKLTKLASMLNVDKAHNNPGAPVSTTSDFNGGVGGGSGMDGENPFGGMDMSGFGGMDLNAFSGNINMTGIHSEFPGGGGGFPGGGAGLTGGGGGFPGSGGGLTGGGGGFPGGGAGGGAGVAGGRGGRGGGGGISFGGRAGGRGGGGGISFGGRAGGRGGGGGISFGGGAGGRGGVRGGGGGPSGGGQAGQGGIGTGGGGGLGDLGLGGFGDWDGFGVDINNDLTGIEQGTSGFGEGGFGQQFGSPDGGLGQAGGSGGQFGGRGGPGQSGGQGAPGGRFGGQGGGPGQGGGQDGPGGRFGGPGGPGQGVGQGGPGGRFGGQGGGPGQSGGQGGPAGRFGGPGGPGQGGGQGGPAGRFGGRGGPGQSGGQGGPAGRFGGPGGPGQGGGQGGPGGRFGGRGGPGQSGGQDGSGGRFGGQGGGPGQSGGQGGPGGRFGGRGGGPGQSGGQGAVRANAGAGAGSPEEDTGIDLQVQNFNLSAVDLEAEILKAEEERDNKAALRDTIAGACANMSTPDSTSMEQVVTCLHTNAKESAECTKFCQKATISKTLEITKELANMATSSENKKALGTALLNVAQEAAAAAMVNFQWPTLSDRTTVLDSVAYETYDTDIWSNQSSVASADDPKSQHLLNAHKENQAKIASEISDMATKAVQLATKTLAQSLTPGETLQFTTPAASGIIGNLEAGDLDFGMQLTLADTTTSLSIPDGSIFGNSLGSSDTAIISAMATKMDVNSFVDSGLNLGDGTQFLNIDMMDGFGNAMEIKDTPEPLRITIARTPKYPKMSFKDTKLKIADWNDLSYTQLNITREQSSIHLEIKDLEKKDIQIMVILKKGEVPKISADKCDEVMFLPKSLDYSKPMTGRMRFFMNNEKVNNYKGPAWFGFRTMPKGFDTSKIKTCADLDNVDIPKGPKDSSLNLGIYTFTSGCYFFDHDRKDWASEGCTVGEETTYTETECYCNHLTTFGGGWSVAPNTIDWNFVFSHADFMKNPTVYVTEIIITAIYLLAVVWARRRDRKDLEMLGVTPLKDNDPQDKYYYEIVSVTGLRRNAGTDSKVFIILSGENEETDVRLLNDDKRSVFRRGGVDAFLMAVPEPLGSLNYARVWHDNSGKGKFGSWYLKYLVVRDVQTDQKFVFICNRWFAVEEDDGQVDRVIPVAGLAQMTEFAHLFSERTRKNLVDGHLWFSVVARPPQSRFTRVQRVSCCLCLLYATMLANAMFYKKSEDEAGTSFTFGPFALSPQQIYIGIVSNLIVFPANFVVIMLFRKSRARRKRPSRLEEALKKVPSGGTTSVSDVKPDVGGIWAIGGKSSGQIQSRPESSFSQSYDRPQSNLSHRGDRRRTRKPKKELPWFCRYIGWLLLWMVTLGAAAMVTFYGISFQDDKCKKWITSMLVSFFTSIFVTQPIKVFLTAIFFSLIWKNPGEAEDDQPEDEEEPRLEHDEELLHKQNQGYGHARPRKIGYKPPNPTELEQARKKRLNEIKMWDIVREIIFYSFFLWILMVISYRNRSPDSFYYKNSLEKMIIKNNDTLQWFTQIQNTDEFWMWARSGLVNGLRADSYYNNAPPLLLRGFIGDKVSRIMGFATMRQLRVQKDLCTTIDVVAAKIDECNEDYSMFNEDKESYGPAWRTNVDSFPRREYTYTPASELNSFPYWGLLGVYGGGGYVIDLRGSKHSLEKHMEILEKEQWVDKYTRAVFVEFTVYNPQVNLFAIATIVAEFQSSGGILTSYRFEPAMLLPYMTSVMLFQVICEMIYFCFTIAFIVKEVRNLITQRVKYFKSFWNLIELSIIAMSISAIVVYFYRLIVTNSLTSEFKRNHGNEYMKFQYVGYWNELFTYIIGWLVFFGSLKFLKLLRFNKRMSMLGSTLKNGANSILHFSLMFWVVFLAFIQLFYLTFMSTSPRFSTFIKAAESGILMMMGKFDVHGMLMVEPILTQVYVFFFVLTVTFILVNMFLSILNETFSSVRLDIKKQNNDYEIVDFMVNRFKKWVGIGSVPATLPPTTADSEASSTIFPKCDTVEEFPDRIDRLLNSISNVYMDDNLESIIESNGQSKKMAMKHMMKRANAGDFAEDGPTKVHTH